MMEPTHKGHREVGISDSGSNSQGHNRQDSSSSLGTYNPATSAMLGEIQNRDRVFRYKFCQLQRKVLQEEIETMKEKTEEMRSKDIKLRDRFLQLQQKRRLLEMETEQVVDTTTSSSEEPVESSENPVVEPHKLSFMSSIPNDQSHVTDTSQDMSFSDVPLAGLGLDDGDSVVPRSDTQGATVKRSTPRRRSLRRLSGRAEPYRSPLRQNSPRKPRTPGGITPRGNFTRQSSGVRISYRSPAHEHSAITKTAPRCSENQENRQSRRHVELSPAQRKITKKQTIFSWIGKRKTSKLTASNKSTGCLPVTPNSLGRNRSTSACMESKPINLPGMVDIDMSRISNVSTAFASATSHNFTASFSSSHNATQSSASNSHNNTRWSLFEASHHSNKDNKYNKAKREAEAKPKKLKKSRSGNKIVPVTK